MKIAFDARMIDHPGIGRYIRNLLSGMLMADRRCEFVLYGDPDKLQEFKYCRIEKYTAPVYSWKEFFFSPFIKDASDIVHIPHFNTPFKAIKNLVVTIHDLIYLKFPESPPFFKRKAVKSVISNAVRRAKKIIAVSQNTKQDIIEAFPKAEGKVKVIYEAADAAFRRIDDEGKKEAIRQKYNLPEDIILFVSSLKKHKNIERLIDAYTALRGRGIRHRLVIVGRYRPSEAEILKKVESTDALYLGEVPADDLVAIYNLATLLVIPSLYEGFGLPALEAMACGVPVVASSASSLTEVIADAGVLFDPYNISDIAGKIYQVLTDETLKKELIEKGLERVKCFSWDKAARETLEVYKEVVGYK